MFELWKGPVCKGDIGVWGMGKEVYHSAAALLAAVLRQSPHFS